VVEISFSCVEQLCKVMGQMLNEITCKSTMRLLLHARMVEFVESRLGVIHTLYKTQVTVFPLVAPASTERVVMLKGEKGGMLKTLEMITKMTMQLEKDSLHQFYNFHRDYYDPAMADNATAQQYGGWGRKMVQQVPRRSPSHHPPGLPASLKPSIEYRCVRAKLVSHTDVDQFSRVNMTNEVSCKYGILDEENNLEVANLAPDQATDQSCPGTISSQVNVANKYTVVRSLDVGSLDVRSSGESFQDDTFQDLRLSDHKLIVTPYDDVELVKDVEMGDEISKIPVLSASKWVGRVNNAKLSEPTNKMLKPQVKRVDYHEENLNSVSITVSKKVVDLVEQDVEIFSISGSTLMIGQVDRDMEVTISISGTESAVRKTYNLVQGIVERCNST